MHIEKKNFDNIFNTLMNVKGKTKDNAKSMEDLKNFAIVLSYIGMKMQINILRVVTHWIKMGKRNFVSGLRS